MIELIKDQIEWFITETARDLYNHELNFNNADPTSGQRCYNTEQIEDLIRSQLRGY